MNLIAIRVDSSLHIGTGHVMRCLTLAEELRKRDCKVQFICREHPGHMTHTLTSKGFHVSLLPAPDQAYEIAPDQDNYAAWLGATQKDDAQQTIEALDNKGLGCLIIDHYGLDARWENLLRQYAGKIMVIDDLANREHDCDLLLDQNLGREPADYKSLVSEHSTLMIGPHYALLRPEFAAKREYSLQRRKKQEFKRLLITMGGVDQPNATGEVLEALKSCSLPSDCRITVVMGEQAPWLKNVRDLASGMPWSTEILVNIWDMAQVMADSDLAIGAAGSTSWERCCLGLPSLLFSLADNQNFVMKALVASGAAASFDFAALLRERTQVNFHEKIYQMIANLHVYSAAAALISDGRGCERVCTQLRQTI